MYIKRYLINLADFIIDAGFIFLIIFMPLAYGSIEVWSQTIFELAVLLIAFAWVVKICLSRDVFIPKIPAYLPIILFFVLSLLSLSFSIYYHASQMAVYRLISYTLLYCAIVNNYNSSRKLKRIYLYLITMGSIVALIGIIGYFDKKLLAYLWPYSGFSTFTTTSHFSGYIGTIFPLSLVLLFVTPVKKKFYFFFSGILMITAALLCRDKGGWVQFISAAIFLVTVIACCGLARRKWSFFFFIAAFFIWAVSLYGLQVILQRLAPIFTFQFRSSPEATIWERVIYWQDTLRIIRSHPIFGTGIGTFSIAYPQFRSPEVVNFLNYAHQDFLQLASEMGLMGLGIFTWIILSFFKSGWVCLKQNTPSEEKALIAGSLAGVFGLLVHSAYDFHLHIPSNVALLVIIVALVSAFSCSVNHFAGKRNILWIKLRLNFVYSVFVLFFACVIFCWLSMSIIKPYLAHLKYEKGQVLEKDFEWSKAIQAYIQARKLDPSNSLYYYLLANLYAARAQFGFLYQDYTDLAISNYHKAISLNPRNGDYHLSLANLYNIVGHEQLAQEHYKKALFLDPNNNAYRQLVE